LHTHYGTDENENDCMIEGDGVEYVDGLECDSRGDKLCDTPADPNLKNGALVDSGICTFDNSKCKNRELYDENACFQSVGDWNGDGEENVLDIVLFIDNNNLEDTDHIDHCVDDCDCLDGHGDFYSPDTGNYMSYTKESCGKHFTPEQTGIIKNQYDINERNRYVDCNGEFMGNNWTCAGCMEQTSCNYNADAIIEDYSCEFPEEGYNCDGTCIADSDYDGICDALYIDEALIPIHFNINRIYPNPFNPKTTISYSIFQFMATRITAYDITGRKLETLTNKVQGPGDYLISWNASSYPSGVYLIKMDSGDFTQTQKLALIK
jgi:hypothetical protein